MTSETHKTQFLELPDGVKIAYHYSPGNSPGVMFLGGFKSDMTGSKALALEAHCRDQARAFLRFDYQGHGESSGEFEAGCIGQWATDAVAALDHLTNGPQVLAGSSMGGWIMLLVARQRPERIAGLVGIAAAPDFTEDLMWDAFSDEQRAEMSRAGQVALPNCYDDQEPCIIRQHLIEDGRNHLLLRDTLPIDVPVRLIQGMCDTDVPWATAGRIQERLSSQDVEVQLIKDGDHRLSRPHDLDRLCQTVDGLLHHIENPPESDNS